MPTPFTHLEYAQRLLRDTALPDSHRALLREHTAAFLLGSIAADARIGADVSREATHFYAYDRPIVEHPWRVMLEQYPTLTQAQSLAQRAFLAGYVAHLALDEVWALEWVRPQFVQKEWHQPRAVRFLALHLILIFMDQRDLLLLENWQADTLLRSHPDQWLPFMPDHILVEWRDFIGEQILPENASKTIEILAARIEIAPDALRNILQSQEEMDRRLWRFIAQEDLNKAEPGLYAFTREQMQVYLDEFR